MIDTHISLEQESLLLVSLILIGVIHDDVCLVFVPLISFIFEDATRDITELYKAKKK